MLERACAAVVDARAEAGFGFEKGCDRSRVGDGEPELVSSEKRETKPGLGVMLKLRVVGLGVGKQPIKGAPITVAVAGELAPGASNLRTEEKSLQKNAATSVTELACQDAVNAHIFK